MTELRVAYDTSENDHHMKFGCGQRNKTESRDLALCSPCFKDFKKAMFYCMFLEVSKVNWEMLTDPEYKRSSIFTRSLLMLPNGDLSIPARIRSCSEGSTIALPWLLHKIYFLAQRQSSGFLLLLMVFCFAGFKKIYKSYLVC